MLNKLPIDGRLSARVIRPPRAGWGYKLRNLRHILRGLGPRVVARALGVGHFYGRLHARVLNPDGSVKLDYGLVATRVVTTAGANAIVGAFQNTVELNNFKFHALGTGAAAEAVGDTALGAELTTQYQVDGTRATGTTVEGASANIFRSVATVTVDAPAAITEHGLFSQATAGGTLFDRSVFAVINLAPSDSLELTYELSISSGG